MEHECFISGGVSSDAAHRHCGDGGRLAVRAWLDDNGLAALGLLNHRVPIPVSVGDVSGLGICSCTIVLVIVAGHLAKPPQFTNRFIPDSPATKSLGLVDELDHDDEPEDD